MTDTDVKIYNGDGGVNETEPGILKIIAAILEKVMVKQKIETDSVHMPTALLHLHNCLSSVIIKKISLLPGFPTTSVIK